VARQIPQTALRSISSESLASMGFPSFAESRNLDSNRSAFADHKSTTGAAHRQIRPPRKTSNQFRDKTKIPASDLTQCGRGTVTPCPQTATLEREKAPRPRRSERSHRGSPTAEVFEMKLARYSSISVVTGQFFNGARRVLRSQTAMLWLDTLGSLPARPKSAH
jgi:hypothetical protein